MDKPSICMLYVCTYSMIIISRVVPNPWVKLISFDYALLVTAGSPHLVTIVRIGREQL